MPRATMVDWELPPIQRTGGTLASVLTPLSSVQDTISTKKSLQPSAPRTVTTLYADIRYIPSVLGVKKVVIGIVSVCALRRNSVTTRGYLAGVAACPMSCHCARGYDCGHLGVGIHSNASCFHAAEGHCGCLLETEPP
jgi:hypothetical protein